MQTRPLRRWISARALTSLLIVSIGAWAMTASAQTPPPANPAPPASSLPPANPAPPAVNPTPPPADSAPPAASAGQAAAPPVPPGPPPPVALPPPPNRDALPRRAPLFGDDPPPGPPLIPFNAVAVEVRDYKEGDRVPPGFHVKKIKYGPLFVAGAVVLGATYGASVISGIIVQATRDLPERGLDDDETYVPMAVPVVGPFLTLATAKTSGAGTALLIALGTAQAAGLGMLIAGTVSSSLKLIRYESPRASISILPSIARDGVGIGIVGAM